MTSRIFPTKFNYRRTGAQAALLLGLAALMAVNALAQTGKSSSQPAVAHAGSVEVTLFAGESATNGREKETGSSSLEVKNGFPYGGRVAYNFTEHHAVEFTIANPLSVYANYVYNFSPLRGRWVPYLTAGVGGSRFGVEPGDVVGVPDVNLNTQDSGPDRQQTAFTVNFGGGVKYLLTNRLALRFDARDLAGRFNATFANVAGAPGGVVKAQRTINDLQITGGIVFRFGGK
ncbi:MAG: outer membrane beta-barrel protein [Blastocatellales bacterium]